MNIYLYANQKELEQEMEHYNARSNYNIYEFIHKHIFKRNEKKEMIYHSKYKEIKQKTSDPKIRCLATRDDVTKWLTMILLNGKNDRAFFQLGPIFKNL